MNQRAAEAAPQLPAETPEALQRRTEKLTEPMKAKLNAQLEQLTAQQREVYEAANQQRNVLKRVVDEALKADKDRNGTLDSSEAGGVDRMLRSTVEAAQTADANEDGTIDAGERIKASNAVNKAVAAGAVVGFAALAQDIGGWVKKIGGWIKEMKAALGIEDDEEKAKREQQEARAQQQATERSREQNEQQRANTNQAQDKLVSELGKLGADELKKLEKGGKLAAGTAADESITIADDGTVTLGTKAMEKLLGAPVAGDSTKRTEALQQLQAALLAAPAAAGGKTELTQRLEKRAKIEAELKALPAGTTLQLAADGKSISKVAQGQPAQPLNAADYGYADGNMFAEAVKAAGVQLQAAPAATAPGTPTAGPAAAVAGATAAAPGAQPSATPAAAVEAPAGSASAAMLGAIAAERGSQGKPALDDFLQYRLEYRPVMKGSNQDSVVLLNSETNKRTMLTAEQRSTLEGELGNIQDLKNPEAWALAQHNMVMQAYGDEVRKVPGDHGKLVEAMDAALKKLGNKTNGSAGDMAGYSLIMKEGMLDKSPQLYLRHDEHLRDKMLSKASADALATAAGMDAAGLKNYLSNPAQAAALRHAITEKRLQQQP